MILCNSEWCNSFKQDNFLKAFLWHPKKFKTAQDDKTLWNYKPPPPLSHERIHEIGRGRGFIMKFPNLFGGCFYCDCPCILKVFACDTPSQSKNCKTQFWLTKAMFNISQCRDVCNWGKKLLTWLKVWNNCKNVSKTRKGTPTRCFWWNFIWKIGF